MIMSLEKEFQHYSDLLKNNLNSSSILIGGEDYTYLNLRIVMHNDLINEIQTVSQTMQVPFEITLANYLQYAEGLELIPIVPQNVTEEDLDYDVNYFLSSYEDSYTLEEDIDECN